MRIKKTGPKGPVFFMRIGHVRMVYYAMIDSREKERIQQ